MSKFTDAFQRRIRIPEVSSPDGAFKEPLLKKEINSALSWIDTQQAIRDSLKAEFVSSMEPEKLKWFINDCHPYLYAGHFNKRLDRVISIDNTANNNYQLTMFFYPQQASLTDQFIETLISNIEKKKTPKSFEVTPTKKKIEMYLSGQTWQCDTYTISASSPEDLVAGLNSAIVHPDNKIELPQRSLSK